MIAAGLAALAVSACGPADRRPIVASHRVEPPGQPAVEFTLTIEREHVRDLSRYVGAARATIETLSDRFGAFPRDSLSMVDPPFAGSAPIAERRRHARPHALAERADGDGARAGGDARHQPLVLARDRRARRCRRGSLTDWPSTSPGR